MWNAKVGSYVSKMILDYQKKKKKKKKKTKEKHSFIIMLKPNRRPIKD